MSYKLRSGADTGFKDKEGNPILVHNHVADTAGAVYFVNAYSQAVPIDDGVAVELDRLIRDGGVRLLSPEEVLKLDSLKKEDLQKRRSGRRASKKAPAEAGQDNAGEAAAGDHEPKAEGLAEAKQDAAAPASKKPSDEDFQAELKLVLNAIPDKVLADELRRRGYVFSAVKPVILNI